MDPLTRQMDSLHTPHRSREWGVGEAAFQSVLALWRARLKSGWTPPPHSGFPWAQVRRSLAALVAPLPVSAPRPPVTGGNEARVLALICAGNTPLLAWPAMLFALRHEVPLFVKMSSSETLWPQLLKESIDLVSPEAGKKIICDVWLGEDPRTEQLIRQSDAVIAYGSDLSISQLKLFAEDKPFLGFGHAISIAVTGKGSNLPGRILLAKDVLMYDQQGCRSPQTIFVIGPENRESFVSSLARDLAYFSQKLDVPPRCDAGQCHRVREATELALMEGAEVISDPELRWSVLSYHKTNFFPEPVGMSVVSVVTLSSFDALFEVVGTHWSQISCIGFRPFRDWHENRHEIREKLTDYQQSFCLAGEMQTPSLDWKNGDVDLEAWISNLST
jgi:hypothetical protein